MCKYDEVVYVGKIISKQTMVFNLKIIEKIPLKTK